MKHRIFILSVVVATLIVFGCGQEGLVSPQLTQSEQGTVLAKATVTHFDITLKDLLDFVYYRKSKTITQEV